MVGLDKVLEKAKELGFEHCGPMEPEKLEFRTEVREMCSSDRCHKYGTSWSCPPGCGTLEELKEQAAQYHRGVIVQSTGIMEDDFDIETIMDTEERHHERFRAFAAWLRSQEPECMPLGAGPCQLCDECTYPDSPCRFPDQMMPSMEACGLLVTDVCVGAGLKYEYTSETITFTSCALLK